MKFLKLKRTFVVVLCTFGNFFLILRKYSYNFFCFFLFLFFSTGVILLLNELSQFSIVFIFHTYFVVASFFEFFQIHISMRVSSLTPFLDNHILQNKESIIQNHKIPCRIHYSKSREILKKQTLQKVYFIQGSSINDVSIEGRDGGTLKYLINEHVRL